MYLCIEKVTENITRDSWRFLIACLYSLCSFLASNSVNLETKIHKFLKEEEKRSYNSSIHLFFLYYAKECGFY